MVVSSQVDLIKHYGAGIILAAHAQNYQGTGGAGGVFIIMNLRSGYFICTLFRAKRNHVLKYSVRCNVNTHANQNQQT